MPIKVKINRLDSGLPLPEYQTEGSSGLDLYSREDIVLGSGDYVTVPTGISIELEGGLEAQIRPRSGLASKSGIGILNSPGTVDSDYRGEIKVILFNFGDEDFTIKRGDRIAQMVISEVISVELIEVEELNMTERDDGGFGSTGE